ncbi:hypothetical protein [Streptomyces sp. WM6378]|uniref:hypothetical protein n=1 Tax=Streptomyces sp. WM6378 TaxID=1415557 RepID=UPI0006AF596A|nr:hypothetical protein [Streptomyces sp. WM6378]KOU36205.1 hypothetical protein ADK54_34745 [Streptomyces sp. WM6378]
MRKIRRTIAMTAATIALAGGTTLTVGGAAHAAPASCPGTAAQILSQNGNTSFSCKGYYFGSWYGTKWVLAKSHNLTVLCNDNGTWYNLVLTQGQEKQPRQTNDECTEVAVDEG